MTTPNALVIVSGHFNPLHHEHVRFLNRAKKLGRSLIVILNSDFQVELKGSKQFLTHHQRKIIMENLKCVDKVVVASDFSPNVVDTLERIVKKDRRIMGNRPILFVNHANSVPETIAEAEICKELGVKLVFLKGKKTISSSKLKQ